MALPVIPSSSTGTPTTLQLPEMNHTGQTPVIPTADWSARLTTTNDGLYYGSPETLYETQTSTEDVQITSSAENAVLRILFGRPRIGGEIANIAPYGSGYLFQIVWGEGVIGAINNVTLNDVALTGTTYLAHYTGTQTAVDSTLAAALPGWNSALTGIAYSVIGVTREMVESGAEWAAVPDGLKLYDPRLDSTNGGSGSQRLATPTTWTFSRNPSLALARFLTDNTFGMGQTVDWASVITAANRNDTTVGGEARNYIDLCIDEARPSADLVEVLRTYAECWVVQVGGVYKLVPDAPGSSVYSFSHASGNIIDISALEKAGLHDRPSVVTVTYTDTSATPYREGRAVVYGPGVLAGTAPWAESHVALPGLQRYSEAMRHATQRYNRAALTDLSFRLEAFDEGLRLDVGDIVDVTHPIGLTAKLMRVASIAGDDHGRWSFDLVEYNGNVYDSTVQTTPQYPDTELPAPGNPPSITGLTLAEETYQNETGIFATRIRITWTGVAWPFLERYRVLITGTGGNVVHEGYTTGTAYATPAMQDGIAFTVFVYVISSVGAMDAGVSAVKTLAGKAIVPGNVLSVAAFEVGGRVFLSWTRADNPTNPGTPDPDVWRYELRRGLTSGSWATATVIDRVDGLTFVDEGAAAGTWRYYIAAVDSVGQYSTTPYTKDVVVTLDSGAFLVDTYYSTVPTFPNGNVQSYTLWPSDGITYYITDDGASVASKFTASPLSGGFSGVMSTNHASVTSTWLGEAEDFQLVLGGQWTGTADVTAISGSVSSYLGYSLDGGAYTYGAGLSQKVNARFARLKHEATGTATMRVAVPTQSIRCDAIPREEVGQSTSTAANAKCIFLSNDYVAAMRVQADALGYTAAICNPDNIGFNQPNPQDVGLSGSATITCSGYTATRVTADNAWIGVRGRHPFPSTGKWYVEFKCPSSFVSSVLVGIGLRTVTLVNSYAAAGVYFYQSNGYWWKDGAGTAGWATYAWTDVIGMAYDADALTVKFYKNNVLQGTITGLSSASDRFPLIALYSLNDAMYLRSNANDFTYSPPSGYIKLPFAFDINIFDAAGARIARDFMWTFKGV